MGGWVHASRLTAMLMVAALVACSPGDGPSPGSSLSPSPGPSQSAPTASGGPTGAPGTSAAPGDSPAPTSPQPTSPTPLTPTTTPTPTTTKPPPSPSPTPTPTTTPTPTPSATSTLPAALLGRIVTTLPTTQKVVALTFDGGASDAGASSILATLASTGVRATFLPTGAFARRYPGRVTAFAAGGHPVGNHSDTHPDFTTLTAAQQIAQLSAAEAEIRPLTGRTTKPWFRFPYGASNQSAITTVNGQGYACIGWTVDTLGWKGTSGGQSVQTVVDRVLDTARPGQIVLMHVGANPDDGSTLDADALPMIISGLRALGYRFVTLDAALG